MKKQLLRLIFAFSLLGLANISNAAVLLSEDFTPGSMPAGWSQDSAGVAPFWPWTFNNPGARVFSGSGFDTHFVIFDSDHDGSGNSQNAYLNLPSVGASSATNVYLMMDQHFRAYTNGYHQIEVSIDGGTNWVHLLTDSNTTIGSTVAPWITTHTAYDITSIAAGQSDVRVRFHYSGTFAWWWAIDNVSIETTLPAPPANDDCANAIPLTIGSTCSPTSFSMGTATNSGGAGCSSAVSDDDVWFSFVANASTCIVKLTSASFSHTIEVFDGCGGSSIQCISPGTASIYSLISGLTSGNTYYLAVYTTAAGISDVAPISICLTSAPPQPANDDCANATSLSVNASCVTTAGTLAGATNSGVTPCAGTSDDDVWYSFVANDTIISVTVNGHGQNNPVVQLFDACGGTSLKCVNTLTGNTETGLFRTLTIGNTYYFRVYSLAATLIDTSDFTVCLVNVVIPVNDDCANALEIVPVANEDACDLSTLARTDLSTASTPVPTCSSSNYYDDVWYYFVATSSTMTISAFNVSPGVITAGGIGYILYDGSCGGAQMFCLNPATNARTAFTGLTIGNAYYFRTFTASSLTEGNWNLCLFDGLFTGVHETATKSNNLHVYPVPTTGKLEVSLSDKSAKSIVRVFDMIGNLMQEEIVQNAAKTTLDLSSLSNGIYFVKVENEKGTNTQKIILSK